MNIKAENQTLATITLQNYFRLYDKLAGMTGTATTEAAELGVQLVTDAPVASVTTDKKRVVGSRSASKHAADTVVCWHPR